MGRNKLYFTEEEKKAAHNESCKKYRENNPEKIKERGKKYRENNPEKVKERGKKYRENNPEKVKEIKRKFKENNPDYYKQWREEHKEEIDEYNKQYYNTPIGRGNCLVNSYRREDKKRNRGECTITGEWIVDNTFKDICFYCDESDWHKLGCDRIYNDLPHTPENVVCCCEECNKKRGTKDFVEFLKEIGRLDKLNELKDKIIIANETLVN